MAEHTPRRRLDQPRAGGRGLVLQQLSVDGEWFARTAENLARFLGTGTYLLWQSIFVLIWIALNLWGLLGRWDPYPFILLNLAFSTQAAYAAPLILLAQNRQDDRDRIALDEDRTRASRTSADTEYLARELAALRLSVGELVTRDFLRDQLERAPSDAGADRATRKAVEKGVERAVDKAVDKAVARALERALSDRIDRSVDRALESAVERAVAREGSGNGHPGVPRGEELP